MKFLNAILIAYLDTYTSVLIDTKYSVFFLIRKKNLDQNNSGSLRMKKSEKLNSQLLNLQKN